MYRTVAAGLACAWRQRRAPCDFDRAVDAFLGHQPPTNSKESPVAGEKRVASRQTVRACTLSDSHCKSVDLVRFRSLCVPGGVAGLVSDRASGARSSFGPRGGDSWIRHSV